MGCYINPPDMTKEEWLKRYATKTDKPCEVTKTHVPVCWIDNRAFTAAAVGYHPLEVAEFVEDLGGRKHQWYKAPREELRLVSPLVSYETADPPENFPEES